MKSLQRTVVLALMVVSAPALRAQATRCRPADEYAAARAAVIKRMLTGTDARASRVRDAYGLTSVTDTNVAVVTEESICSHAATAYDNALPLESRRAGRSVYVWRAGNRYIVEDPTAGPSATSEFVPVMSMDSDFVVLAVFAT